MKFRISNRHVDGGYGWLVVFSSFLIQLLMDGIIFSFGNLLIELLGEFNEERSLTAAIGSVLHGMLNLTGPLAAVLCDRYGSRAVAVTGAVISCVGFVISTFATSIYYLYVTYGFIGGLGLGLSYLSANVCVITHFNKYRGLANGISVCGAGAGTFVLNNLTRYLIDYYGWRGCVLLEAGLCLQCIVFALFLLPPIDDEKTLVTPHGNNKEAHGNNEETHGNNEEGIGFHNPSFTNDESRILPENEISHVETQGKGHNEVQKARNFKSIWNSELVQDRRFLILLASTTTVYLAFAIPINFTADNAVQSGMSKYEASWLASSIGITNAAGRIFFGWVADRKRVDRKILFMVLLFVAGVSTAVSFLLTSFYTRMIYTCLFGACIGGFYSLLFLLLTDMFGTDVLSKSMGLLLFMIGIAALIASPIGGLMYDWTGNYHVTFILAGSEFIIGGLFVVLLKPCGTITNK